VPVPPLAELMTALRRRRAPRVAALQHIFVRQAWLSSRPPRFSSRSRRCPTTRRAAPSRRADSRRSAGAPARSRCAVHRRAALGETGDPPPLQRDEMAERARIASPRSSTRASSLDLLMRVAQPGASVAISARQPRNREVSAKPSRSAGRRTAGSCRRSASPARGGRAPTFEPHAAVGEEPRESAAETPRFVAISARRSRRHRPLRSRRRRSASARGDPGRSMRVVFGLVPNGRISGSKRRRRRARRSPRERHEVLEAAALARR